MPSKWGAKKWKDEHKKLLESLFEESVVTPKTTPKQLAEESQSYKKEIYDKFNYGVVNNKLKAAKKRFFNGMYKQRDLV